MSAPSLTMQVVEEIRDDGKRRLVAMHDEFAVASATEYAYPDGVPGSFWVVGLTLDAAELLGYCDPFVVEVTAAARSALAMVFHLYSRTTVAAA